MNNCESYKVDLCSFLFEYHKPQKMKLKLLYFSFLFGSLVSVAQSDSYWQQHVDYTMDIDVDVDKYQYKGIQKLVYTNNSPDTLDVVFYHLQFNSFQPGSEMDVRLHHISDPDGRMAENKGTREDPQYESRIAKLSPDEIGYQKIQSLKQDGKDVAYEAHGSIMKVNLNQPILPGTKTTFDMKFEAQVPVQIRRSGRNNADGVALSMSQWYPKLAEYDFEGWHANAYIAREFHGVWGNFDVTIHIDKDYTIGGTGYLQNPQEIGHGYEDPSKELKVKKGKKLSWHFIAPDVHDFTWAADPDYIHTKVQGENDVTLHFFYKDDPEIKANWELLPEKTQKILAYFNKHIGQYPYKQYSVIQGGDGGMEYAMCTLITGGRKLSSLISVTSHEFAHSWFQFVLASNETKHPWMDEGFTSYISSHAMNEIMERNKEVPNSGAYNNYYYLAASSKQEPLSTYADRYESNTVYGISAYSMGSIYLSQLGYIIGEDHLAETIKRFYTDFKFKHPTPNDISRTAEKVSGLQLAWYLNYWTQTTKQIDYSVTVETGNKVVLNRVGTFPMPIDLEVTFEDGTKQLYNIPLQMMYGNKPTKAEVLSPWSWVQPNYIFETAKAIAKVQIDPMGFMADVDKENNTWEK